MKRTRLDVTDALHEYAEQYGAYFDKVDAAWYVDGDVPIELEELVADRRWRSYSEGFTQASGLVFNGRLDNTESRPLERKILPTDLRERITVLTKLVETLAGGPHAAMRWLQTPKVALGHLSPLEAMTDLSGCDSVEKLMFKTFEHQL